jgi:hypothetical protein
VLRGPVCRGYISADDTITIITTIHPAKNGKRAITVAGAPDGAAPRFALGTFAERHALFDAAYAEVLKRAAKAETKKPSKAKTNEAGKTKTAKRKAGTPEPAFGQPGHFPSKAEPEADETEESGPIGPIADGEAADEPADLPVIEGDDAADSEDGQEQLELTLEDSDE